MKTPAAIQEFMLSRGSKRPRTQSEYRNHLALFLKSFPDELPQSPQPLQAWVNRQGEILKAHSETEKLSPETVHARFRTLRALYKQVHRWHLEVTDPMPLVIPPERDENKARRIFVESELYRLFNLPLSPRDRALLTLMLDIGPRAGECTNLTWDDVIPGFVYLEGKTQKRQVPISDVTGQLIEAIRPTNSTGTDHVFLGKRGSLTYQGIYKLVHHLCRKAGINGQRCSPHTFRHSFATLFAGAESCDPSVLKDILGHRDFKTTLRYIQNNPYRMARNHQRCTPLKDLAGLAQGRLFEPKVMIEADAILAHKGGEE